jgi:hypothetical protein
MSSNGKTDLVKVLTDSEKLDLIIEALADMNARIDGFEEEICERLSNLSMGGADYAIDLLPLDES